MKYALVTRGAHVVEMEMFGLPREDVLRLIGAAGGRLLETRPDDSHGDETVRGFEYWVTR